MKRFSWIILLIFTFFISQQALAANLILNGDFSLGNTSFSSQYPYTEDNAYSPPVYSIGHTPTDQNVWGADFGDHTTGDGLMLIANGATTHLVVWEQEVSVDTDTNYIFGAWTASWGMGYSGGIPDQKDPNPANLEFYINGSSLGSQMLDPNSGLWTKLNWQWDSGAETSALLQIIDLTTAANGNDFALDDLSLNTVPLPGAVWLLGSGLLGLIGIRKRKSTER